MSTNTLQQIKLSDIVESKTNPRKHFDEPKLKELAESIKVHGVLSPIILRQVEGKKGYELVAGARRYRAAKIAELDTIPAFVPSLTDQQALEMQVIENLQRDDLHPLEEAEGYEALIKAHGYTAESLAAKIGKSSSYIRKRLQLTKLHKDLRKAWYDDRLQLGHALILSRIEDENIQKSALKYCLQNNPTPKELSEEINDRYLTNLSSAPFKLSDAELKPDMGACTTCQYNTGNRKDLFDEVKGQGMCTQPKCFQEKVQIHFDNIAEDEKKKGNVIIPTSKKKSVFSTWGSMSNDYIDPESSCWEHPKNEKYKVLFGGRVKEHVVIDNENQIRRLYLKKDVQALMAGEKWYKKDRNGRPKFDRAAAIRKNRVSAITDELYHGAILQAFAKKITFDSLTSIMLVMMRTDIVRLARTIDDEAKKINTWDYDKGLKIVEKHILTLQGDSARLSFILKGLIDEDHNVRELLAKKYKIDEKKFSAAAKKQEAEEFKAKQAKKKANGKKPAKKK
jgi:ParB/RepB/Spo0J family partition protein